MRRLALACLALFACALPRAFADVAIVSSGSADASTYVLGGSAHLQNFNTLPLSGGFTWAQNSTLPGWYASDSAGAFNASAATINGTATNPANLVITDVGATSADSDRALAYHTQLASAPSHLGLAFVNQSGRELTAFSLAFAAEQWREATNSRTVSVSVSYRVGAVAADLPATTGWNTLPDLAASTLNGSAPSSSARSVADIPVSVPDGATLWIRWTFANTAASTTNSHDILAIDDVAFSASYAAEDTAPVFTTQPSSQTVFLGEAVAFTVTAAGNPAPTYQWFKTGNPEPVGTGSSYIVASVTAADAGDYFAVATNSSGSVSSNTATLVASTEVVAPVIVSEPASVAVPVGGATSFTVVASGTAPLSYQWFRGEDALPEGSAATYVIPNVSDVHEGDYTVVVSNSAGQDTSAVAHLDVLHPPVISTQPSGQTATVGGSASFGVAATGDGPFTYQWRKGGDNLAGATATSATLALSGLQFASAGSYDVVVTGPGGSTPSDSATLVVNGPPSITTHPASRSAFVGGSATFTVSAIGTAPLTYQWRRGGDPLPGQTGPSLTLTNLQLADSGATFDVIVGNAFGTAPSAVATLTVTTELAWSAFDLQGFATLGSGTTGGGIVAETDAAYRKCYTAYDFVKAIYDSSKTAGAVRVIEIMNDLDLGYLEVDDATRALGNFRAHATPKLHPRLIATGVSLIDTSPKNGGLTIFSANGSSIRHTCLNIKNTSDIIIRNLRFDEMWEWDEASKGDYDSNDWDFIDLSNGGTVSNVWIDHCTFTKAYDGIADFKKGTQYVTMSWCRYVGDDGATNPNSFVRQQIAALEANRSSYAFYNFLRNNGFSVEDIVQIIQGHDKGHLMGATELDAQNDVLSATFHHQWFENIWDRCVPRLRGGQVHNYNIYVDDSVALVAKRLRDTRKAAMGAAAQSSLENTYSFNPFLNGSISTEGGALLVEKSVYVDCITPLRNNQTDPSNPAYTGKIKAIDSRYVFHNANGTTTSVRGDSTDAGNPMGPFQAAVIPFSWNTTDGSAPYPAPPMDDPDNLLLTLQAGAGAGRLTWPKSNWLRTANADAPAAPPTIVTSPQGSTLAAGQSATLTVVATGTAPLAYQWYLGASGDTAVPVGTNSASYATPALSASASYWVRVSNSAGSADSAAALLVVPTAFETWAAESGFSGATASDDDDGDGVPLLLEYALGLDPLSADASPAAQPALAPVPSEPDVLTFRFHRPTGITGVSYTVETASSLAGPWTATETEPVLENTAGGMDTLAVEIPVPPTALFARLRVTLAP